MESKTLGNAIKVMVYGMVISSCTVDSKKASELLDVAYEKALLEAIQLDNVVYNPCRKKEDYRYRTCFVENTGSAAITMEKLRDILVKAGFKTNSTGSMEGELDGGFTIPGTPYTLSSSFGSFGIQWVVYEKNRGFAAPRPGKDDPKAPYAVMSPKEFARLRTLIYTRFSMRLKDIKAYEDQYEPCGETTEESASYCVKPLINKKYLFNPIIEEYFVGDKKEFDELNLKEEFVYRKESKIKEMIEEGILKSGHKSPLTFTKVKSGLYTVENWRDYPAYKVTYELTPKDDKYAVKVTATRIPIHPKAQKNQKK